MTNKRDSSKPKKMCKVTRLYKTHEKLTVNDTLRAAVHDDLLDVVLVGIDKDDNIVLRTCNLTNASTVWAGEYIKAYALGLVDGE